MKDSNLLYINDIIRKEKKNYFAEGSKILMGGKDPLAYIPDCQQLRLPILPTANRAIAYKHFFLLRTFKNYNINIHNSYMIFILYILRTYTLHT